MTTLASLTQKISSAVGSDSGLDNTLKFNFGADGVVFIDGATVNNQDLAADLTVTISLEDFVAIGKKQLDVMSAVMTGRMQLSNMGLAMAMQSQMKALFSKVVDA